MERVLVNTTNLQTTPKIGGKVSRHRKRMRNGQEKVYEYCHGKQYDKSFSCSVHSDEERLELNNKYQAVKKEMGQLTNSALFSEIFDHVLACTSEKHTAPGFHVSPVQQPIHGTPNSLQPSPI